MMIFINLIQFVSLSLWIESTLFVIQLILTQFFQPIFYKFIVLVFLGLSPFILGRITNLVLTIGAIYGKSWSDSEFDFQLWQVQVHSG